MEDLQFTVAHPGDWPGIWDVFRRVVGGGDSYPYPPDTTEEQARRIWMAPSHTVFVARMGERVAGTAYHRPNMVGLGDHIANAGWMVHPDLQGKGIGRRFAVYVMDHARDAGYHGMQFNAVVASNTPAVALWESLGFEIVGTIPEAFRHARDGLTPIHIMYRRL